MTQQPASFSLHQTLVGVGALGVGGLLAAGATTISSEAGYAGVGPNFLPWVVAAVLLVCGAWLVWEARSGGFRSMEEPSGAERGDWPGFAWVSAGLLANAVLINYLGFILSCTVCFVLAVRGFRAAAGHRRRSLGHWLLDAVTGFVIAAPVYWMFTQLLAINLPGLTDTGWL
ncbi:tripartite tricarboxylate transporter TctB family protein [Variovorax terrae]|uniref:Tripartite tricarboxylate transporter TctB family protein n=1 Tax=Variovorax terrae TaxID=2923278 RepID=A0A9X1VT05_9BURK|nr:tripartite tricarboxylate transporter TctB family protein [Variovorax terrae]MCJ0762835.1 tripartite tricarboxylate transporter TctB family protein [Variovorax terrae]